jgi:hypothetical protein
VTRASIIAWRDDLVRRGLGGASIRHAGILGGDIFFEFADQQFELFDVMMPPPGSAAIVAPPVEASPGKPASPETLPLGESPDGKLMFPVVWFRVTGVPLARMAT